MNLSAVVLCFNSARYIEDCVRSLRAATESLGPVEMFVVDNGSSDGSVAILERLEQEFPGFLQCIYLPQNTGTTVSRNKALRRASGRHLLIMDSDATVTADTLSGLARVLEEEPRCGMAVPRVLYPDGRFQISTDQFPTVTHKLRRFFMLKSMEATESPAAAGRRDVDYAISAVWLLKRELLESVGLLDENIFYSPEDVDYCLRVWQAGYRIVYEPAVTAVHDAQEISRGKKLSSFTLRHAAGLLYYFRKHRYAFGLRRIYRRLGRDPA